MARIIFWLHTIRGALAGATLRIAATFEPVHPEALKETGIRIVAALSDGVDCKSVQNEVWEGLQVLRLYDTRRMRRVMKRIAVIFIQSKGSAGAYMAPARICILNHSALRGEWSPEKRRIAIAGLLVHEATHGVISAKGIPRYGRFIARIERICDTEQRRVLNRLEHVYNVSFEQ